MQPLRLQAQFVIRKYKENYAFSLFCNILFTSIFTKLLQLITVLCLRMIHQLYFNNSKLIFILNFVIPCVAHDKTKKRRFHFKQTLLLYSEKYKRKSSRLFFCIFNLYFKMYEISRVPNYVVPCLPHFRTSKLKKNLMFSLVETGLQNQFCSAVD